MENASQTVERAAGDETGRRARNAGRKRDAILAGARAVFMAEGYGGASMDAIAEAAGVSKMTLYRYFDGKEALFAGLVGAQCERILARDPAVPVDGLPADALAGFARRLLRIVYAPETLALHRIVLAELPRFPELGRLFYESGPERNIGALADWMAAHAGDPALGVDPADPRGPREAAEAFFELVRGYTHLRLLLGIEAPPDEAGIDAQARRAVRRFLRRG